MTHAPTQAPSIAVVLPRGMCFSPQGATSIDTVAWQQSRFSPWQERITLYVHPVADNHYLPDVRVQPVIATSQGWPWEGRQKRWLKTLVKTLRQHPPALIEVHQHVASALYLANAFPHLPVTLVRHHILDDCWRNHRRLHHLAAIISVSHYVQQSVKRASRLPESHLPVLHNGLDAASFQPEAERPPVLLMAGRLRPEKGWLPFAQALAELLPQYPDWRVQWFTLGDSPQPDFTHQLKSLMAPFHNRLDWQINQPPEVVRQAMCQARVVTVPSLVSEAFGLTALEAHLAGAAVVSSGIGGLREVSGETALYCEPEKHRLQHCLTMLMQDEALRQRLAQAGRERALRQFDIRTLAARQTHLWQEILQRQAEMRPSA